MSLEEMGATLLRSCPSWMRAPFLCQILRQEAHERLEPQAAQSALAQHSRLPSLCWSHGPSAGAHAPRLTAGRMTEWEKAGFSPEVMKTLQRLRASGHLRPGDEYELGHMLAGWQAEATMKRFMHAEEQRAQIGHPAKGQRRR